MRLASIDFFKTIAIFAIIVLHTSPFHGYENKLFILLDAIINQATRFAIPYFFIVAGYFLGRKLLSGVRPEEVFKTYLKRLFPLFIVWSVLYMILPTNIKKEVIRYGLWHATYHKISNIISDPITLSMQGGRGNLWFLISLLMAFGIITLFLKLNRRKWIIPIASLLYFVGLWAGSYSATDFGINISFFTRNGPFFSTLLVAIGWYLAYKKYEVKRIYSLGLLIIGVSMHAVETFALWKYYNISPLIHDYLVGTLLWGIGLTLFVLSIPNAFEGSRITKWGRYTLGVYLLHVIVGDMLTPLDKIMPFPLWDIINPFIVYFVSLFIVLSFSKHKKLKYIVTFKG
jgi:surface polysaccharide O-acyltransferase-like enzyme